MSASTPEGENGDQLQELIIGFLHRNNFLHEYRLQKLVYIADLISQLENGNRITDADFKPYMYGTFSEDLRETLESLTESGVISYEMERRRGNTTKRYYIDQRPDVDSNDDTESSQTHENVLNQVDNAVSGWKNDDLGEWSKNTWLYKNTDYGSNIDFSKINPIKNQEKEKMKEEFPELGSFFAESNNA